MVLGVMLQFQNVSNLSSFTMLAIIAQAGGRSNKVSKVRIEWVIRERDNKIRAQAGCWTGRSIKPIANWRGSFFERIVRVDPCGRFGESISKNERDIRVGVIANGRACSASKAVAYRIM